MPTGSPFPGMDPWLESHWGDVHASLAIYTRDQLNARLGPGLVARAQERVYVESPLGDPQPRIPDSHVFRRPAARPPRQEDGGVAVREEAAALPQLIEVPEYEVVEHFIEIRDAESDGPVITVIEFVSDTNKSGSVGRKKYLRKQREVVRSETNLVEIDLLRDGKPVTLVWSRSLPGPEPSAYHACVRRAANPRKMEYYPMGLRERLPRIAIPLRPDDRDVLLDLQAVVDEAYRGGRYAETIDYARPPRLPLDPQDLAWAQEVLQKRNAHAGEV